MFNEFQETQKMILAQCRFAAGDSQFVNASLGGGFSQPVKCLFWRVKLTKPFRVISAPAHPAEDASKTAADSVAGGNAAVDSCRAKGFIFAFLSIRSVSRNDVFGFLC